MLKFAVGVVALATVAAAAIIRRRPQPAAAQRVLPSIEDLYNAGL